MKYMTKHFGSVEYSEKEIIEFPEGLPGFTKCREFIVINNPEEEPFVWLQSLDRDEVSFVLVDPKKFRPNYKVVTNKEGIEVLKSKDIKSLKIYCLVTMNDEVDKITMNLRAPILINENAQIGTQMILKDSKYDIEYRLFAPSTRIEEVYHQYESGYPPELDLQDLKQTNESSC